MKNCILVKLSFYIIISSLFLLMFVNADVPITQSIGRDDIGIVSQDSSLLTEGQAKFNQKVSIIIKNSDIDISNLNFRLQEKLGSGSWVPLSNYSSQLPTYTFNQEGIVDLQIDIINKNNEQDHKGIWLGQFKVQPIKDIGSFPQLFKNYISKNQNAMKFNQYIFLCILYICGLCLLLGLKNKIGIINASLMSFPFGVALWCLVSITILITGIPYKLVSMGLFLSIIMITIAAKRLKSYRLSKKEVKIVSIVTLVFLITAAIAANFNCATTSYDSVFYIQFGKALAFHGGLANIGEFVASYGIFVPVIHSSSIFFNFDFAYGVQPLITLWFVCSFFWLLYESLIDNRLEKRKAVVFSLFAALTIISSFFIIFQSLWIMNNLMSGIFLFYAIVTALRASLKDDNHEWLFLSLFAIISFSLTRIESPLFSVVFLAVMLTLSFPYKVLLRYFSVFLAVIVVWYTKILLTLGFLYSGDFWTTPKAAFILAVLFGLYIFVFLSKYRIFSSLRIYLPLIMIYVFSIAIMVLVFLNTKIAVSNFRVMVINILQSGLWTGAWTLLIFLLFATLFLRSFKHESYYIFNIVGFLLLLYLTFMFRVYPLRLGFGDSGNRMLTHIFPIIVYYLYYKLGLNFNESTD